MSLPEFSRTLKGLADFFSDNFNQNCFERTGFLVEPELPYSAVEDQWLKKQMTETQELLWSVPITEDVLRELLLHSIGVVPTRHFVTSVCRVFVERIWRILDVQLGFNDLEPYQKNTVVQQTIPTVLLLLLARQEVLPTGVKQCQEMFGNYHELEIHHRCQSLMAHPAKMKRFWLEKSCLNILNSEVKKLSFDEVAQFESEPSLRFSLKLLTRMTKEFDQLLSQQESFQMLLLLTLTTSLKRQNVYLRLFSRQLSSAGVRTGDIDKILQNLFNVNDHFLMISGSVNFLLK